MVTVFTVGNLGKDAFWIDRRSILESRVVDRKTTLSFLSSQLAEYQQQYPN
jgi:hypothetical protein